MTDKLLFTCRVCGCDVASHGFTTDALGEEIGVQGVCPEHCEDHDFEYDRERRGKFCLHCDEEQEYEPNGDDVCILGGDRRETVALTAACLKARDLTEEGAAS